MTEENTPKEVVEEKQQESVEQMPDAESQSAQADGKVVETTDSAAVDGESKAKPAAASLKETKKKSDSPAPTKDVSSKKKKTPQTIDPKSKLIVVRIRGLSGIRSEIRDTMTMLNLHRKHFCSVYDATPSTVGMIKKCKDFVTYGEGDDETVALVKKKMGEKKFARLNPPVGGFERKGIKVPFTKGGVLGYRGDSINQLVKRMV